MQQTTFKLHIESDTYAVMYPDDTFYPNLPPEDELIPITNEQHETLLNGVNILHKYIYIDKYGIPQLRDKFTKLIDGEWVIDQDAIDKDKHQQFINSAQISFDRGLTYGSGYLWNKLAKDEQNTLTKYLDALDDIISGKDTKSTELPEKPIFIK